MNNNALLLAISDIIDKKLDSVHVRMDTMENRLIARIDEVDNRLSAKIDEVDNRLSADIRKLNISMENIVIPRLNHIEQCYLSTSERYINETGRIEGLVVDVQIIKSVVQNHSEYLQNISA